MDSNHLPRSCTRLLLGLVSIFFVAGCSATRPWTNAPLGAEETVRYDGLAQMFDPSRLQDVLVVANFSGGGSRSAAFAYAVMKELDAAPFVWQGRETTLAREVDMVTGVSGGSVAAAHMALHGVAEHLAQFPTDFLEVDFQGRLTRAMVSPLNWRREASPFFGRGHLLARELDAVLFRGATFGDLAGLENRPYLIVGATDLSSGAEFDFTSDQMASLCSSIDAVPLAFSVAASSAVPALFAPLTLQSHRDGCPRPLAPSPSLVVAEGDAARTKLVKAESLAQGARPFVHLIDGGVSDNLGVRRITDYVAQSGGIGAVLSVLGVGKDAGPAAPRRVVFVSVSSERRTGLAIDRSGKVPSVLAVIGAMLYSGLGRHSMESSLVFREAVDTWRAELKADPRYAGADVDLFNIEVHLSDLEDEELRERVLRIPTEFRISAEDLELLREAAARGLAQSPDFRRFLQSTGR